MYVVITVFSYMYTTRGDDEKDHNLLLCSIVLKPRLHFVSRFTLVGLRL